MKLTDEQIIQEATEAVEKNLNAGCYVGDLLRIIKEKKAEIERLKHILVNFMVEIEDWEYKYNIDTSNIPKIAILGMEKAENIKAIRGNAIKEFAEKFKEKAGSMVTSCQGYEMYETKQYQISAINFDNLVKEMVGDTDAR